MGKKTFFLFLTICVAGDVSKVFSVSSYIEKRKKRWFESEYSGTKFLGNYVKDIFVLHWNIFSLDTLKVTGVILPAYVGSRAADKKIHSCFYDPECHKNINQLPDWCHTAARWAIAPTTAAFGVYAFLGNNYHFRITSQAMLVGLPFVIFLNRAIKKFSNFDACLRPWSEHFSKERQALGGFPSGHVTEGMYLAVLYGKRFGLKLGIPLGIIAAGIGAIFTACNRHFFSQIVAGFGFGAIYGLAAEQLVEKKCNEYISVNLAMNTYGGPEFQLSCRF